MRTINFQTHRNSDPLSRLSARWSATDIISTVLFLTHFRLSSKLFTFGPFRHLARRPAGSRCIFRPSNPRLFRFSIQPGAWGKKDRARCKIDASLILFARRATRSNENKNPVAKEKDGRETDENILEQSNQEKPT